MLLCFSVLAAASSSLLASAQMIRIPLQPHTLPLGKAHPTRSAAALSRQLFPLNGGHHGLSLYVDPSRPVSLTNYFNRMYTGTVAVGTPAKEFSLVFDTGEWACTSSPCF
jgi:hypothetical protein